MGAGGFARFPPVSGRGTEHLFMVPPVRGGHGAPNVGACFNCMVAPFSASPSLQDKINSFWEISKKELEDKKAELRNKEREMEELEERHQAREQRALRARNGVRLRAGGSPRRVALFRTAERRKAIPLSSG